MGDLNPERTYTTNRTAPLNWPAKPNAPGLPVPCSPAVARSTARAKVDLDETATLNPVSAYAESKIATEREVVKLADNSFSPGVSAQRHRLRAFTEPPHRSSYSPTICLLARLPGRYPHHERRTRALRFIAMISPAHCGLCRSPWSSHPRPGNQTFGGNDQNYQVRDVGDAVQLRPNAKIVYTGRSRPDLATTA